MTTRKTKIVATVGPASRSPETLRRLIKAGVNVFRLNFSHGSHEEHTENFNNIREASSELGMPVAILQDLSGPKIRISEVVDTYQNIQDGEFLYLKKSDGGMSTPQEILVELLDPAAFVKPGETVLMADGIITLEVSAIEGDRVKCQIMKGGRIRSRVGIAFPDSDYDLPATTEKDFKDIAWGIKNGVDYAAISFVNDANDIERLRDELKKSDSHIQIISKIERKSAIKNIDEIVEASDGLMVARGDLGLEFPLEKLPRIQKQLIEKANFKGIPVIVATQMLHSMITSVRPTRAEVSDIATAVMSGADAVMLSEETAIGEHPIFAVEYLGKVAAEAEREFDFEEYRPRLKKADSASVPDAVSYAAAAASIKVQAVAVIACTETGNSARLVAKYRPQLPLFGASSREEALRRMCLFWGIQPLPFNAPKDHADELETALANVKEVGGFQTGDSVVITAGLSVRTPGATSVMQIRTL